MNEYKGIPGWFDWQDYYSEIARIVPNGARLVEIGTLFGASASCLRDCLIAEGKEFRLTLVDSFLETGRSAENVEVALKYGGFYKAFLHFSEKSKLAYDHRVSVLAMDSIQASSLFSSKSLDFVFLDGDHKYDYLKEEIRRYSGFVKTGGIIAGHDYSDEFPDVARACHETYGDAVQRKSARCWQVIV